MFSQQSSPQSNYFESPIRSYQLPRAKTTRSQAINSPITTTTTATPPSQFITAAINSPIKTTRRKRILHQDDEENQYTKIKATRKSYLMAYKIECIDLYYVTNMSKHAVALLKDVPRKCLQTWIKTEAKIRQTPSLVTRARCSWQSSTAKYFLLEFMFLLKLIFVLEFIFVFIFFYLFFLDSRSFSIFFSLLFEIIRLLRIVYGTLLSSALESK